MPKKNEGMYKDDLIDQTFKDFENRKNARTFLELQWRLNIEYYNGNQYTMINKQTQNIEEVKKLYWFQEMECFNQIAPIVETRLAKLGRLKPIPRTRPATDTQEDINNSKVSNKLLETTYYNQGMKDKQAISHAWAELTGTAFFKPVWDKTKGRPIGILENEKLCEGDIDTIVVNCFEIYPDSMFHETIKECKSIIHAKAYSVEEIKEKWGIEVKGESVNVFSLKNTDYNYGSLDSFTYSYKIVSKQEKNSAVVVEKWEMPSNKYPKGRLIICTKDTLLYGGELPYMLGEDGDYGLPFEMVKCIKVPGMFYGKSIVERLIPLQRRYNSIKNRKAEYINRVAIGQITYEEGSIDEDLLEEEGNSPGLMIPYKRGFNPPKYIQIQGLPSSIEIEEQNILNDFIRISGVSELAKDSRAPTGVKSGIALGILQEQDDTKLSLTAGYMVDSITGLGKKWLRLYKQFADTPRILRRVGDNLEVEVVEWDKSVITSDDVYVDSYSQSIESLAQRRNMVFDLLGAGLFNDPDTGRLSKEGRMKVFEMIQLGNWENADDLDRQHKDKANRENNMFKEGNFKQADSFDDDFIHINTHNSYRLTKEYEELIMKNPIIKDIFEYHINMHLMNMQNMAIQQSNSEVSNGENQ